MSKNIIPDMTFQGKYLINFVLIPGIIILVGVASFGLGRLSALKEGKSGLVIYPAGETADHGNNDTTH